MNIMALEVLWETAEKTLDSLQEKAESFNWHETNSEIIVKELKNALKELEELQIFLEELKENYEKKSLSDFPNPKEILGTVLDTIKVFEKNIELEKNKTSVTNEEFDENEGELFASLQQKLLNTVLDARFYFERVNIFEKKQNMNPIEKQTVAKNVMDLLDSKEQELQDLRKKYQDIRKKTFWGFQREENAAELEQEMHETDLKLEKQKTQLNSFVHNYEKSLDVLQKSFIQLKMKISILEQNYSNYYKKASELITLLKNERDVARKTLLEAENETIKMRNHYSKELLSLEEKKIKAKQEAEEKLETKIQVLKKRLNENEKNLKHFRDLAVEKSEEAKKLEKKLKNKKN